MRIETPPTPEWIERNKGNALHTRELPVNGKEYKTVWQVKYRSLYDVIAEQEILRADYTGLMGAIHAAKHAFDMATLAFYSHIDRASGGGDSDGLGERMYKALLRDMGVKDMALLVSLSQPLDVDEDIATLRHYLLAIVPDIDHLCSKAEKSLDAFYGGVSL